MTRFLVTNANGYIALHIVDQLLKEGHFVRCSVRNVRDDKSIAPLLKYGPTSMKQLELVEADLLEPDSWIDAVETIDIVIHVINPSPIDRPGDGQGLMKPSISGTINVLNAAANSNVKRVIVNSSASTMFGSCHQNKIYDETDWAEVFSNKKR